jgi:hypothetical protein
MHWLNNVRGVYLVQVSLLLIDQQGLGHFLGIGPCFPLAGGLCKLYANAGGKRPIHSQPLLVQYKHQANPLLSMHYYTPLVISRKDKNKKVTLLIERKLTLTRRKYVNGSENSERRDILKIKNQARRFFRPISIHICHQKPNTDSETVLLRHLVILVPYFTRPGAMNDIKDAVDGEAPPVARIGGDRLGGPPPPVTPRFLQHVQAAAPRCKQKQKYK